MSAEFRRILLEAAVIVLLGVVLGLSFNGRLLLTVFSGAPPQRSAEVRQQAHYPVPVSLEEVRELAAAGGVLVDARAAELYAEGHLPGARSLPLGEVEEHLDAFREAASADTAVVTYCNGYDCPDSFDLGVELLRAGWRDVRVFEGGYPEWRDAGLPVERGAP